MSMLSTPTCGVPPQSRFVCLLTNPRSRQVLLQSLVSVILSYELLVGSEFIIGRAMSDWLVAGLWLCTGMLAFLPAVLLEAVWFTSALVVVDTLLVTGIIYVSGNARPDLYIAYFVLMLVAASVRRLSDLMGLCLLLSLGYGVVLYEGTMQTAAVTAGQLLGIPVLLVMAVFYGVALETITVERAEKSSLLKDVEALKQTEEQLLASKSQLEARIKGLKDDLANANEEMREGLAMRQGLERRLREAQKMESVGRIAAGIAGEFGGLFAVIGKQTGIMLSQLKPDDPLRTAADEIFQTGEQAAALTAQLIALNIDGGQVREVLTLQSALMELEGVVRSLLPNQIELAVSVDAVPACVEVDREGLEKVVLQLVVNGRDAMPDGGRLAIEARVVAGREKEPQPAGAEKHALWVLLQVSDTGTGMNLDTQAQMFEPFFSTKETNIGLGLTAVYGIVRQHGGTVEVESRPGQGTVVRVWLPAIGQARTAEATLSKSMLAKGDETILVVNEDEIGRKLARSVLTRHKYRVLEAGSPVEALMLAQRYKGIVHLTVSPLTMPEIGGRELARRLLTHHPMMKALFVSSYGDDAIEHHRINRRFVLQQPYRHVGLVEKVRELLDVA